MADIKKKPNGEAAMADNKNKSSGQLPSPSPSKGSKFADRFNKFINLCTEMKNDAAGAIEYEKTLEENTVLKATLAKRADEINKLKAEVEQLKRSGSRYLDDFGKKYVEFDSRLKDADSSKKTLAATQAKLDEAVKKIKNLEGDNKQLERKSRDMETVRKNVEQELAATQDELQELDYRLRVAQQKISFYAEDSLVPTNLEHVGHDLEEFAEKCHQVVMSCFEPCEAPPRNISPLITYLDRCPGRHAVLPLTNYTTKPARLMRCAAAELVIANAMVDHIFTDIYLPGEPDPDRQKALVATNAVAATLDHLARTDPRREALVRCQLLQTNEADMEVLFTSVCSTAYDEVCAVLDNLLPAGDPRDMFHNRLRALLNEALELWRPLQRSKTRVCARLSVGATMLNREEDAFPDYDGANASTGGPGFAGSQPVILLFPLIWSEQVIVCRATAVWSDQGAFIEARNEASEDRLSMGASFVGVIDSAKPSVARRRMSISGRTPSSPTSSLQVGGGLAGSSDTSGSHLVPTRSRENGIKLNATK